MYNMVSGKLEIPNYTCMTVFKELNMDFNSTRMNKHGSATVIDVGTIASPFPQCQVKLNGESFNNVIFRNKDFTIMFFNKMFTSPLPAPIMNRLQSLHFPTGASVPLVANVPQNVGMGDFFHEFM